MYESMRNAWQPNERDIWEVEIKSVTFLTVVSALPSLIGLTDDYWGHEHWGWWEK